MDRLSSDDHLSFHRHVWLMGLMGSGKSSVGAALATKIKNLIRPDLAETVGYVDMDNAIVEDAGRSVEDLFKLGEATFRSWEQAQVKKLANKWGHLVVSTGGGAPCFYNNLDLMERNGTTVYLRGKPEIFAQRTLDDELSEKPSRPLLQGKNLVDRVGTLASQLGIRGGFYEKAGLIVDVEGKEISTIVDEIIGGLKK